MDGKMTVGQLIAFQMIAGRVGDPVLRLVSLWQQFQQVRLSLERLGDILNSPIEQTHNLKKSQLPAIRGEIKFEEVNFRYRTDGQLILDRINLEIKPSSKVAFVGRFGSGKSTITKIIQRLYTPETGRVLIDGINLQHIEPTWLRRQPVEVKVDSFNFQKYGTLPAKLIELSSDAVEDKEGQLRYRALISLEKKYFLVNSKKVFLTHGMTVTAEIKTKQKAIIEYFLEPFKKYASEGLKER